MYRTNKHAFTMLEVIFVIVAIGILAAIAVPKFSATRVDAKIARAKATVAAVRSGIVSERQTRMLQGDSTWITPAGLGTDFGGVLQYPDKSGMWSGGGTTGVYTLNIDGKTTTFTYDNSDGTFSCTSGAYCTELEK